MFECVLSKDDSDKVNEGCVHRLIIPLKIQKFMYLCVDFFFIII